jgi:hypothetical protein
VLAGELGLLFLLVAVLPVIHDPRDRRIRLLRHDNEIEVVIRAMSSASSVGLDAHCEPSSPISRTRGARMFSFSASCAVAEAGRL